jgi:hypothetical protein
LLQRNLKKFNRGFGPIKGVPMKEIILDISLAIVLGLAFAALALEWFDVLTY